MPEVFSRNAAATPRSDHEVVGPSYPAVFVVRDEVHLDMWCEHSLIMLAPSWCVHITRVQLAYGYQACFWTHHDFSLVCQERKKEA